MAEIHFLETIKNKKENVIIPILCHFIILNCSCRQKRVDGLINCKSYIKKFIDVLHDFKTFIKKNYSCKMYIITSLPS